MMQRLRSSTESAYLSRSCWFKLGPGRLQSTLGALEQEVPEESRLTSPRRGWSVALKDSNPQWLMEMTRKWLESMADQALQNNECYNWMHTDERFSISSSCQRIR